jgi:hypothetical protein
MVVGAKLKIGDSQYLSSVFILLKNGLQITGNFFRQALVARSL